MDETCICRIQNSLDLDVFTAIGATWHQCGAPHWCEGPLLTQVTSLVACAPPSLTKLLSAPVRIRRVLKPVCRSCLPRLDARCKRHPVLCRAVTMELRTPGMLRISAGLTNVVCSLSQRGRLESVSPSWFIHTVHFWSGCDLCLCMVLGDGEQKCQMSHRLNRRSDKKKKYFAITSQSKTCRKL